jgi:phage terminase small subunit
MAKQRLTAEQKLFCDNYLVTSDVKKASLAAGYKATNYLVLSNPCVKEYLKEERRKLNNAIGLNFWWKAKRLTTIIESVMGNGEDPEKVDLEYANIAISAIVELNKMQGHHAPDKSIVMNLEHDEQLKVINEMTLELVRKKEEEIINAEKDAKKDDDE